MLKLHHELDDIARSAAAETLIELMPGVHRKRRRFLVVEGAETGVAISSGFAQLHVIPDDVDDVDGGFQLLFEVHEGAT